MRKVGEKGAEMDEERRERKDKKGMKEGSKDKKRK